MFPHFLRPTWVSVYKGHMDYRTILKEQFEFRRSANPQYSLRSFAKRLALSPSKLSEVMRAKKRLSPKRAADLAERLRLNPCEREIFILSTEIEATAKLADRWDLANRMKELAKQVQGHRSAQRNAWYFGVIRALDEEGLEPPDLHGRLGITELQIESARRYHRRMQRNFPERRAIAFEPVSVLRKIEEECYAGQACVEAEFLYLSDEQVKDLKVKFSRLVKTARAAACGGRPKPPESLRLVYFGVLENLIK